MNDFPAALRQYQEAVKIAENANAASPSDLYARWRLADSYDGLGNYYATIASKKQESSMSPIENWQLARSWYQKSHRIWNDWPLYAKSTNFDISRKQQAAQSAARCESELAQK